MALSNHVFIDACHLLIISKSRSRSEFFARLKEHWCALQKVFRVGFTISARKKFFTSLSPISPRQAGCDSAKEKRAVARVFGGGLSAEL
jgi:hypothetical protein